MKTTKEYLENLKHYYPEKNALELKEIIDSIQFGVIKYTDEERKVYLSLYNKNKTLREDGVKKQVYEIDLESCTLCWSKTFQYSFIDPVEDVIFLIRNEYKIEHAESEEIIGGLFEVTLTYK